MKVIAVDFDGTCVRHEYPGIGEDVPGAVATLRVVARGDRLILWTVRDGAHLADAVQWFKDRDIELWGVNENPEQRLWNGSRKVYAEAYIDDAAVGAYLERPDGERPFVNWTAVAFVLGVEVEAGRKADIHPLAASPAIRAAVDAVDAVALRAVVDALVEIPSARIIPMPQADVAGEA